MYYYILAMSMPPMKREREDDYFPVKVDNLKVLKTEFYSDEKNKIVQNALCSNHLYFVSEVREYMQSHDAHFSHTIDPKLVVSNQGLSGRCWMFSLLNVMRHELIRKLHLPYNFELSESYLSFYEKLEKSNYFLNQFIHSDNIDVHDLKTIQNLLSGCEEGGTWITCANLIKKYGIIPKSSYSESINSFDTTDVNNILGYKLREFALLLVKEQDKEKRLKMRENMTKEIYNILSKMLGTPPTPDEKIEWSFNIRLDINEQLAREIQRMKNKGNFETLQIKKTLYITPLEFYQKVIIHKLDDYYRFSNDPRNEYNKYYQSHDDDEVIEGEKNGFYNLSMDDISKLCIKSIKDNTPVQFDCDVGQYIHPGRELLDTKCFNYDILFNTNFNNLSKKDKMDILESYANHAMVLVGVDLDDSGKPLKWKIENSWGREHSDAMKSETDDSGYYTMSHEWFEKFAYNVVVHKKYVTKTMVKHYKKCKEKFIELPEHDIMA